MKAVVFLNMGAPSSPEEVDIFLKNMFNDKNIITVKSDLLRKIIAFFITLSRSKNAKENYSLLNGQSPLIKHTKKLISKISSKDKSKLYLSAMRYTPPYSEEIIKLLKNKGVKEVFLFPLYPQYSTTTTKSSIEDFLEKAKALEFDAKIEYIERFYEEKLYNLSIINRIKEALKDKEANQFDLIFSAHSLPQKIIDSGDPYNDEIKQNVEIIKEMLKKEGLYFNKIDIAYQSKLGPVKWLEPSLEDVLKNKINKKVLIYPISFVLDNSETEFELKIEYEAVAKRLGFKEYIVSECINDSDIFVTFIENMV